MASRIYPVPYQGTITSAGGNVDYLYLNPVANKPVTLRGWIIGQTSELGDAQEEGLRFTITKLGSTVTVGSGGSAVTMTNLLLDGVVGAAGFTARCNDTTVATSSGTTTVLMELSWNIRATPWEFWFPDPMFAPTVRNGEALVFRQESTLADDISATMTFFVEEG